MHILALETSALSGSVAALDGSHLLAEIVLPQQQRTAQALAPAIAQLLANVGWQPNDVQLVAVTQGPGSFTGLRVGVTTAKSFAYAVQAEVLGINTLETVAQQAGRQGEPVHAVIDAHRGQLFAATFRPDPEQPAEVLEQPAVVDREQWLNGLPHEALVTGPGLRKLKQLPEHVHAVQPALWIPLARTVGLLADRHHRAGRRDDLWKLAPHYYRPSAAEEKADGR